MGVVVLLVLHVPTLPPLLLLLPACGVAVGLVVLLVVLVLVLLPLPLLPPTCVYEPFVYVSVLAAGRIESG